jgi:adenylate cyclase
MNIGNLSKLRKTQGIPRSALALAGLIVLGIYLFATAPADLDDGAGGQRDVPVETLFRMLDAENASVRALYTSDIVGPGLKRGLKYREDWRLEDVHAGPLPALMLRETANRLQQRVPELNLFLGSTFPIEESNRFKGAQLTYFKALETKLQPQFFLDASTGRYTAMFPDIASAPPCVSCHNEHPKSPRKDWKQNDVMGATTWSFARNTLSTEEVVTILAAYRAAALDSYGAYLKKTANFAADERPELGERWPKDGLFLPDRDVFRERVEARNSAATLNALLHVNNQAKRAVAIKQDDNKASGAAIGSGKSEKAP